MKLPSMPRKGYPVEATVREIINFMRAIRITSVVGGQIKETSGGTMLEFKPGKSQPGATAAAAAECFFGEILTSVDGETTTYSIRGGTIYCGDKNFNAADKVLTIGADAVTLIYLEIDCEANRDDDGEIILPGILTSAETDPATFWQSTAYSAGPPATQYPDNTNPPASTGLGTIIIPIGKLTVASGVPTLLPVGCGNIHIDQCAGTLSHTRL